MTLERAKIVFPFVSSEYHLEAPHALSLSLEVDGVMQPHLPLSAPARLLLYLSEPKFHFATIINPNPC